jgi:hypothetical protein
MRLKKLELFFVILSVVFFAASGDVMCQQYSSAPIFHFKNETGRDPFSARQLLINMEQKNDLQISTLMLEGITNTGSRKTALFSTTGGFKSGYIFEDGALYGDNDKVIEGITGKILNKDEIILRQGDKEVIFKLDKDVSGYNIRPE